MEIRNRNDFELMYKEDGVHLGILLGDVNNRASQDELLEILKRKKIEDIDTMEVKKLYSSPSGGEGKIAPPQTEQYIDDELVIEVSKDKLTAQMMIRSGEENGNRVTIDDAMDQIHAEHISYGLNQTVIDEMVKNRVYDSFKVIATGTEAINGVNGYIDYKFETEFNKIGEEVNGRIDFKNLNLFANVTRGSVIATKTPPTMGVDGTNVLGEVIPAKDGLDVKFVYGKNVFPSEDGNSLLAGIDGKADLVGNKVVVSKVYTVSGDVDLSVGNIDFAGDVVVTGNVLSGFEVKAGGSIEVYGLVEGAQLKAKENVRVSGSFLGNGQGMIDAGGCVYCRSVENGVIKAGVSIDADVVMHSNLLCKGTINISGEKSNLIGGNICSQKEIIANNVGSVKGTATNLKIECPPDTIPKYNELNEKLNQLEDNLKNLEGLRDKAAAMKLDAAKKMSIMNSIIQTKQSIGEIRTEISELEQTIENVRNGRIQIRGRGYNGVNIYINNMIKRIDFTVDYTTYVCREGEIQGFPCN